MERYDKWKTVVKLAIDCGVAVPGMSSSLAYFESFRRGRLPANLVQARPRAAHKLKTACVAC